MTCSERLINWAWKLDSNEVPGGIRQRAALHLLDSIGVALAGRRLNAAPFAVPTAQIFGVADEATIIGESARTSAAAAAFANGMLMHALDFDDTHTAALVHASAVTIPVALALGEQRRLEGREVLLAIVAGFETVSRLGAAAPHGFHARGFHATSVCGTISAALVASRLLHLSEGQAVNAIGIAGSFSSGSMEFLSTGAATKQIHPGWASLAGLIAANLARNQAAGPETILDGKYGLFALFTDRRADMASLISSLGQDWQTAGIAVKPYPACHLIHASLDAASALRDKINPAQVRQIIVTLPEDSMAIVAEPVEFKKRPRTSYEAKFSVQWSIAAMLRDGEVGIETFDQSQLSRPEILALCDTVTVQSSPISGAAADAPGDVTVELRDGRRIHSGNVAAKPDLRVLVEGKFRKCAGVSQQLADEVIGAVNEIEDAPNLDRLMDLLSRAGREHPGLEHQLDAAL